MSKSRFFLFTLILYGTYTHGYTDTHNGWFVNFVFKNASQKYLLHILKGPQPCMRKDTSKTVMLSPKKPKKTYYMELKWPCTHVVPQGSTWTISVIKGRQILCSSILSFHFSPASKQDLYIDGYLLKNANFPKCPFLHIKGAWNSIMKRSLTPHQVFITYGKHS